MAGSGVRPENAALILRRADVCEIHASCAVASPADPRLVAFGFAAADHRETDAALVAALRAALADA
jgi:copper homeostasis protein